MISVIIPVYNTVNYLKWCINSVLNSSYKDFELILVDDGSTDGSAFICRECCKKDSRVKYFRQKHQGVSAARNRGMDESSGTWIVFVDSDDLITPDFLEMVADKSFQEQELLLFDFMRPGKGKAARNSGDATEGGACCYYKEEDRLYLLRCLLNMEQLHKGGCTNLSSPCAKAYKKAMIEQYRFRFAEELSVYEDRLFNIKYLLNVKSCTYIQRSVYLAVVRLDSAMRGPAVDFLKHDILYQKRLFSILNQAGVISGVGRAYYNSVLTNMTNILVRGIFHPQNAGTYEGKRSQCRRMQRMAVYRRALRYNRICNLPRQFLLFFYRRECYRMVEFICKVSYQILKRTGRL